MIVAPVRSGSWSAFLEDPVGHWFSGDAHLGWCADPRLWVDVIWTPPSVEESKTIIAQFDTLGHPSMARPVDMLFDVTTVDRFDLSTYAIFVATLHPRVEMLGRTVARGALVLSNGVMGRLANALVRDLVSPRIQLRTFFRRQEALQWLGRQPDEVSMHLDKIEEQAHPLHPLLHDLRVYLEEHHSHATLELAARHLKVSVRTLQRQLQESGRRFRQEVNVARIQAAEKHLAYSSVKIDAIASALGFQSLQYFCKVFRQITGEAPSAYRARRRSMVEHSAPCQPMPQYEIPPKPDCIPSAPAAV